MKVRTKLLTTSGGKKAAEVINDSEPIGDSGEILDIMADVSHNDCNLIIIHSKDLTPDFFDLKTGIAGEILQKFSNYRMRLAIVGDFSKIKSKSFGDFIRESNRQGEICFVESVNDALIKFDN